MRPRGLDWNVHRGQLLCIKKRSSQTRKPHAARCPTAAALPAGLHSTQGGEPPGGGVAERGACTSVTQGERESYPPTSPGPNTPLTSLRPPAASAILSAEQAVECQE